GPAMATIPRKITRRAADVDPQALAVSPHQACRLLGIGNTRLYQLLAAGELETYREGRARQITTRSIYRRVERLIAENGTTGGDAEPAPPPGGRPAPGAAE